MWHMSSVHIPLTRLQSQAPPNCKMVGKCCPASAQEGEDVGLAKAIGVYHRSMSCLFLAVKRERFSPECKKPGSTDTQWD